MSAALLQKPWLEANKQELNSKISAGKLPHALLLVGENLAGQDQLAQWLGDLLLCQSNSHSNSCGECKHCQLLIAKSHPDQIIIDNADKTIGVDLIRSANEFLQKTAQLADAKVVIIQSCEKMTESAANALLKTLEEPTNNSYLLLVCNDVNLLLPTILSRCSIVTIKPPTGNDLKSIVGEHPLLTPFSNLSQLAEFSNEEVAESAQQFSQGLVEYLNTFVVNPAWFDLIQKSNGLKWLNDNFNQLIRMQSGWQNSLTQNPLNAVLNRFDNDKLWQVLNLINNATKQIKRLTQANKSYIMEALLVDIEQVLIKE